MCVCGGGLCEETGEGGGHGVPFLIDQQLLSLVQREGRESEEEGGLRGVRQCVCSVFR